MVRLELPVALLDVFFKEDFGHEEEVVNFLGFGVGLVLVEALEVLHGVDKNLLGFVEVFEFDVKFGEVCSEVEEVGVLAKGVFVVPNCFVVVMGHDQSSTYFSDERNILSIHHQRLLIKLNRLLGLLNIHQRISHHLIIRNGRIRV